MAEKTPQEIEECLKAGNARFQDRVRADEPRRAKLARGQSPPAIVLGCSDSRVAPEALFDAELGDLFVVRVAGNVANRSSIASIEYAVANLGARLIVVLAHEGCGAVTAAIAGDDGGANLNHLLEHILPAVRSGGDDDADAVARRNARHSAEQLTSESEILRNAVEHDGLRIVTGFFHFTTGAVEFV